MNKLLIAALFCVLCICSGCRHDLTVSRGKNFNDELSTIYNQQLTIRRDRWMSELNKEYAYAATISNIIKLEMMLENSDLSNADKNNILLKYFDRAALYMQILVFPAERDRILNTHIKNELIYELGSIFLHRTISEKLLQKILQNEFSDDVKNLQTKCINILENQKIEYDTLRINDANAWRLMPEFDYPCHLIPPFDSLNSFRSAKIYTPLHNAADEFFVELEKKHGSDLPLILLKTAFHTPHELNNSYPHDKEIRRDFTDLILELIWIYQSRQIYSDMHNAFLICGDFKKNNTKSHAMAEANFRSELAFELACLKMLSSTGNSPFAKLPVAEDNIPQLPPDRIETLKLIFNEIQKRF